jgi:hypothetical protein
MFTLCDPVTIVQIVPAARRLDSDGRARCA